MLLFLQYILEFETRITKDTAAEKLKRSCHIVKYIDRLLIWGCKFFFSMADSIICGFFEADIHINNSHNVVILVG